MGSMSERFRKKDSTVPTEYPITPKLTSLKLVRALIFAAIRGKPIYLFLAAERARPNRFVAGPSHF